MPIEEVIQEATIEFQRLLSLEETEKLLGYISKNLPGRTHYISSYGEIIDSLEKGRTHIERTSISIEGIIIHKEPMKFSSFRGINVQNNSALIGAIRFETIPGYNLKEHRPEEIQLWKEVRQQVFNYFSQKN